MNGQDWISDSKKLLLVLLAVGSLLLFVQVNAPSLDSDGIHYAAVAKELARSNRWLLPYDPVVDGHYYFHFHLSLWPTALAFKFLGVSPATAKLFSLLMTLGAAAGLFVLGRILVSPWAGWCAGLTFFLTNHVLRIARQCRPDLPMIGFMVWAFVGLILAQSKGRRWYLLLGLGSLGAILTKETGGLVPLVVGAAYLLIRRRWSDLFHPAFLAAWVVAIGPPVALAFIENARYHNSLWANYHANNLFYLLAVTESLKDPWYYYGRAILDKYWYLLPLAVAGGGLAWREIRSGREPRWWIVLMWAAAFPIGFSFARHKMYYYILPSYAATALLVGLCGDRWMKEAHRLALWRGVVGLAMAGAVGMLIFPKALHKTRYADNIRIAPQIDALVAASPGEVIVARQDVASLLFYCNEVTRITTAHEEEKFQRLLSTPDGKRRWCLIGKKDWQLVDPEARRRWKTLLDDGTRLFLTEEPVGPASGTDLP